MNDHGHTRRRLLALLSSGAVATGAGCVGLLETGGEDGPGDEANGGNGDDGDVETDEGETDAGDQQTQGVGSRWPAIDAGYSISNFEDLGRWEPRSGRVEAAPEEARTGSQAVVLESDGESAGMSVSFPSGLDLEEWDTSMAVKPESVDRIVVEFLAPTRDERLTSIRIPPNDHDGWMRVDCGYEQKPGDEPDLSNVTQINVVADGPDGGPTRMLVDDFRRTGSVTNGKAILALYGGLDSHLDLAAGLLDDREWAAAVPVTPNRIGDEGRLDLADLKDLRARGWDVCSYPDSNNTLADLPDDQKRQVIDDARTFLDEGGFSDGSRHFFAPDWRLFDPATHEIVRDVHETGFVFGGCPSGVPPTGMHAIPVVWGPALEGGVRRHVNLASQYGQLTVLRIPRLVEDAANVDANSMSVEDFEHLLDHVDDRGLDVITPSNLVDDLA